jgi:hypothetical protein
MTVKKDKDTRRPRTLQGPIGTRSDCSSGDALYLIPDRHSAGRCEIDARVTGNSVPSFRERE